MNKLNFQLSAVIIFLMLHVVASAFPVKIMFYPSITRDDEKTIIFKDRISQVSVYFFRDIDEPANLKDFDLELEFPEAVRIRSVVPVAGWVAVDKIYDLEKLPAGTPGQINFKIPLPAQNLPTRWNPDAACGFTGFHSIIYLEPSGAGVVPDQFSVNWNFRGPESEISGVLPFESVLFEPVKCKPRLFQQWIATQSRYMDCEEIQNLIELYKGIAITHVNVGTEPSPHVDNESKLWLENGVNLYSGEISKFIFQFDRQKISDIDPTYCHTNLLGENVHGTSHYRNTPWCPSAFYDPSTSVFADMLSFVREQAERGVKLFYSDHEVDIFSFCYCSRCLKQFATFMNAAPEIILEMKPLEIARKYPFQWYCFRCLQSAKMGSALKDALGPEYKDVRIGLNSSICYVNNRFNTLGFGRALFAEDSRITDPYVDFHNFDSLSGGIKDAVLVDTVIDRLKKPVIARTYSSYCYGWAFAHCSGRFEKAKVNGLEMGYNQRPRMQWLSMLNLAASGCQGLELLFGGAFDAKVVNAAARASEIIAELEDVWFYGKRVEDEIDIYPVLEEESPYYQDSSMIAGRIWGFFLKGHGPVMYRAHRYGDSLTVSIFNWDLHQPLQVLIATNSLFGDNFYICERSKHNQWIPPSRESWKNKDLQNGIPAEIPPLDCVILTISRKAPEEVSETKMVEPSSGPPKGAEPFDLYFYRKEEPSAYGLEFALQGALDWLEKNRKTEK